MAEIDHSTPPQPEPEPAVPILASHLLRLEQKQRTRFTRDGRPERLSTHCEDIDEILGGGVERGIVMGISSESMEGRLISLHLLSSILLSHLRLQSKPNQAPKTKATIIDTTGSFPLQLLARVLKLRITSSHALTTRTAIQTANYPISHPTQSDKTGNEAVIERELQQCLEMISITRVFDVEGLWEVLGEVGRGTASSSSPVPNPQEREEEREKKTDRPIQSSPDWPSPQEEAEAEINDSQASSPSPSPSLDKPKSTSHTLHEMPREQDADEGIEIIIIDTLAQIINELFSRKERNDAHTILTLLSRQIHTLTATNNILTLLHNTTTSSKPTYFSPYQNPKPNLNPHQNPHHQPNPNIPQPQPQKQKKSSNPQPTPLFPSNPLKPALGSLFSQFPSLHIFASSLPKTREDAEVLYARDDDVPLGDAVVGYCCVVEVLGDECVDNSVLGAREGEGDVGGRGTGRGLGYREQRWCAVEIDAAGTGLKGAFEMRGGMKGMGLEKRGIGRGIDVAKEKGRGRTETDVGNVAKIWGFGGRRV